MEPLRPQDPREAGAYQLTSRLGEGGQGVVFLGEADDGARVAVKFLKAENASDPQFRRRFAREVAAAQMVSGPYTGAVMDADPDGDPPWLATAYIPGSSLTETIERDGPLPEDAVRALGAGLAAGLASIHICGLVHRDLKPANVILADDGPRIIDFGVARTMTSTTLTTTGMVIGTVGFMSPEQVGGVRVDTRSDVFSLGSILAYAATGESPFAGPSMAATAARIASGPPVLDGVGRALRGIIEACLVKDPAERPGLDTIGAALRSEPQTEIDDAERIFATDPFQPFPLVPEAAEAAGLLPLLRRGRTGLIAGGLAAAAVAGIAVVVLDGGPAAKPPVVRPASVTTTPPASAASPSSTRTAAPAAVSASAAAKAPARRPAPTHAAAPAAPPRAAAPRPAAPAARPPQAQRGGGARSGDHGGHGSHGGHGGHGGHGR